MKVAIISPTAFLKDFSIYRGNMYHMVLAHRYLSDHAYREFYDRQRTDGSTIILDNGACELKSSIAGETLMGAVRSIKPNYLVLPDVLDDGLATVERTKDFLSRFATELDTYEIKLIAVPQGRTREEWLSSFLQFYSSPDISVIGISSVKGLELPDKDNVDRKVAIEFLISEGYDFDQKKIHILGMGDSGHEEMKRLRKYDFIEGIDTSAPVVHGYHGVKFEHGKEYTKIHKYLPDGLDKMNADQISLIKENIDLIFSCS